MSNDELDLRLKELLGGLEAPYSREHWEAMSSRLDQWEQENDPDFDEKIGTGLEQLAPSVPAAHWAMMSQALDQYEKISDEEFDRTVADRLKDIHAPYHPEYWEKMLARQAAYRRRMTRFILLRAAEVLLLILLWMNWPFSFKKDHSDKVQTPAIAQMASGQEDLASVEPDGISGNTDDKPDRPVEQVYTGLVINDGIPASEASLSGDVSSPGSPNAVSSSGQLKPNSNSLSQNPAYTATEESGTVSENIRDQQSIVSVEDIPTADHAEGIMAQMEVARIPALSIQALMAEDMDDGLAESGLLNIKKASNRSRISISPFISADFNAINSFPNIQQLDESRLKHLTLTPGAGLGIGFHNGPWSVNTGLAYAYRFYDPNITEQFGTIQGYQELNFNKVSLHMLQLPIRLNYTVIEGMKYSFYISGGASLHYILSQQFEKPKRPISSLEKIDPTFQAVLDDDQYRSGSFIGRFNEVTYITADLGFGIERKLNEDLSVYIQPTYMRMFGAGVGPNFDVIHTLSLQLGLRM